jgi:serine/threonine protein kinase/Tol biopolymer transport system component
VNDERWTIVDRLLGAALEREPHERAAFLREACGDDEALRRDVESLVTHASSGVGLLSTPALADGMPGGGTVFVGQRIGSYTIQAPLGVGGMGEVYRARDGTLGRDVAIKILPRAFSIDPDRRARFDREARLLAALNHPHIGAIYGVEHSDGVPALVLELVEGDTLAKRIARGALPINEALTIAHQIADALDAAHEKGITHRDLKPANIKITPDGVVKVLDFGLAKAASGDGSDPDLTQSPTVSLGGTRDGVILGTAAYMSPEQARGKPIDKRTDVWAFGCVVYEMLTGRVAFGGDTLSDTIAAILDREPEWSALPAATPAPIRRLLLRCLDKDAKRRLRDIGDVRTELDDLMSGAIMLAPATAMIAPTSVTATPSRRSYRWGIVVTAVGVLSVIGLTIVWQLRRADYFWRNPLASARTEWITDFEGEEADAAISPNGKVVVFLADRGGPFDVWLSQIGTSDFVNVTKAKVPAPNPGAIRRVGFFGDGHIWISEGQGSGPYTLWMAPVLGGEPRRFLAGAMEPAWSPDGKAMAYHTVEDGDPIFVADHSGRSPTKLFTAKSGDHCHHLTWSPDGRFLYFVMGRPTTDEMDVWRIPAFATPPVTPERITTHNARVAYLGWLDDRTLIYSGTADDGSGQWLYALDSEHRIPHRVSSGITEQYLSVTVSNTEPRRLIASVATPSANLWTVPISDRVQTEADVSRFSLANTRAVSPRVASDYLLFLSSKGGGDGLWKLKEGAVTELWKGSDGGVVAAPAISPGGTQICFSSRQQSRSHLYLMSSDGTNVRRLTDAFDVRGAGSWSPDGKWIAVAANDGTGTYVYVVPVNGGSAVRLTDTASYNPLWSPDGFIVYSEPLQGSTFVTKAITPDKVSVPIPDIRISYLTPTPYRFAAGGNALIFLKEGVAVGGDLNFYMTDLKTGQERQLTNLEAGFVTRSFDLMPGGKIIFDRLRERSDLVLIDLVR